MTETDWFDAARATAETFVANVELVVCPAPRSRVDR